MLVSGRAVTLAAAKFTLGLLAIGFAASALVQLAPGFGTDERELDPRLGAATIQHLKARQTARGIPAAYIEFLRNAASGNLGHSLLMDRPVRDLLAERWRSTAHLVAQGWVGGWVLAFAIAAATILIPSAGFRWAGTILSGSLLCFPVALLAYLCAASYTPAFGAIAAIVFARVFSLLNGLFASSVTAPYITGARARGASTSQIFFRHILSANQAEIVALSVTSLTVAVAAAVPVEVLSDQAGIGQLAWKAAMGRDLPLLVTITIAISAVTLFLSRSADLLVAGLGGRTSR